MTHMQNITSTSHWIYKFSVNFVALPGMPQSAVLPASEPMEKATTMEKVAKVLQSNGEPADKNTTEESGVVVQNKILAKKPIRLTNVQNGHEFYDTLHQEAEQVSKLCFNSFSTKAIFSGH